MASHTSTERSRLRRFDILAAIAGLLFAMLLFPLRLLSSNLLILGIPLVMGIASMLYLVSIWVNHEIQVAPLPGWGTRVLPSLGLLGMAGLVFLAATTGTRGAWFYIVAIAVAVLILYQIVFSRDQDFSPTLILAQIVVLAFIVRLAALYTTTGYVGIDIWTHVPNWTAGIVETNSLAPLEDRKHFAAPVFHLLIAATAMFGGISVEHALTFSVGLVMPLLVVLVYATGRIFMDQRWSAFAAALFAITGYTIEWSIHLIPTSLGLAFFVGIFYLLCRLLYYRFDTAEFILLWLLNIAVVLTHQISTFITLVLMFSSVVALLVLPGGLFSSVRGRPTERASGRESANLIGLSIFDLGFVTFMWSLTPIYGRSFLEIAWAFFEESLTESEGFGDLAGERGVDDAPVIHETVFGQLVSIIDVSVFLLLFLLAIVGGLYTLRRENLSYAPFMMGVSIAAMSVFVFAFPMFGIRSFIPTRWYAFMAVPMILLAALGTGLIYRNLNPTVAVVLLLCFILAFPAASLVSSSATVDSPAFASEQTRYSYTATEIAAVETVDERFPFEIEEDEPIAANETEALHTDHPYQTVFYRTNAHPATVITFTEEGLDAADTLVYREYQRDGAAYLEDEFERRYSPRVDRELICSPDRSTVYDNGDVVICQN